MSDSESNIVAPAHATMVGGKTLDTTERPRYKSWRKKYRKMRVKFDNVLEDNRRFYKQEQKLEGIARRLREELDGLLDLCLDINQNPALPPDLRFNVSLSHDHTAVASYQNIVPSDITPQQANDLLEDYTTAVKRGHIPHLDLHVVREHIERKLAEQGTITLDALVASAPVTLPTPPASSQSLPPEMAGDEPPGFLTTDQEEGYLLRLDAKLGDPLSITRAQELLKDASSYSDERYPVDLGSREAERLMELYNPQSQHNWLKAHAKHGGALGPDPEDVEGLLLPEIKTLRGANGGSGINGSNKRNLAKQVGDRALLERAREGLSPGAASTTFVDEDELSFIDDYPGTGSGKKKSRADNDGTYKGKSSKAAGGSVKGKRKRTGEDLPVSVGSGKKAKIDSAAA